MLAAATMSSCFKLLPATTALVVASVMGRVALIRSSAENCFLGASFELKLLSSCSIESIATSRAFAPRLFSSYISLIVFMRDAILFAITYHNIFLLEDYVSVEVK